MHWHTYKRRADGSRNTSDVCQRCGHYNTNNTGFIFAGLALSLLALFLVW